MSKKKSAVSPAAKKTGAKHSVQWALPIEKINFIYFYIAVIAIIAGYILMSTGITSDPQQYLVTWANPLAIVVGPAVLVFSYCVLIPLAILKRVKVKANNTSE